MTGDVCSVLSSPWTLLPVKVRNRNRFGSPIGSLLVFRNRKVSSPSKVHIETLPNQDFNPRDGVDGSGPF